MKRSFSGQCIYGAWMLFLILVVGSFARAEEMNYSQIITEIGRDLAALVQDHPLFQDFSCTKHVHPRALRIDYAFRTHDDPKKKGWLKGVPNPDPDGIWLYIDFHDPDSQAQLHTQPVVPRASIGAKEVLFLLFQGQGTDSLELRIRNILEAHGIRFEE